MKRDSFWHMLKDKTILLAHDKEIKRMVTWDGENGLITWEKQKNKFIFCAQSFPNPKDLLEAKEKADKVIKYMRSYLLK